MSKLAYFAATVVISIAPVFFAQTVQAQSWDMYITFPVATSPNVQGVQRILDGIEQQSGGDLKVRLHLGGSLPIAGNTITQAVADNIVQMGDDAFFQGNVPIAGLLRLPMLIRNAEEFRAAEEIVWPYIVEAYNERGIIALGEYAYPLQYPFSGKKLTSLADLKSQKLRPTSPEQGEFLKRFGAIPVTAGAAEVPPALERKTFDGVITASAVGGKSWKEYLNFALALPLNYGNSIIIVNKAEFEGLDAAKRESIRALVAEQTRQITETLAANNDAATEALAAGGMTVTQPSEEDAAQALEEMESYWAEWAEARGPKAVEALAKVRTALGR